MNKRFVLSSITIFFLSALLTHLSAQGSQVGNDIDGESSGDLSGLSISFSADGSRLAIGAPFNDGNGSNAGHVRIYDWNGTSWVQIGSDINGEAAEDKSGWSVSLSADGNRLAIGAIHNDGNGQSSGHVRVFSWNGSNWIQLGNDIDGEGNYEEQSGTSTALSADGNRVAIGATGNNGNGYRAGSVRVYNWSGSSWVKLGSDIDGEATEDYFGTSVSLSANGDRLAIGANQNDGNGSDAGHVRVYDWNGSSWVQLGNDIDGEAAGDRSGASQSLSADGNRLAIGAIFNHGNGSYAGHVRIYDWNGSGWVQLGSDIDGEAAQDWCGTSVSLSADGNRLAIGAQSNDNENGTASGHVRVYKWTGSSWVQLGSDFDGEAAGDFSGNEVALSSDGSLVAISSTNNSGNGPQSGHVRVFDICEPEGTPCDDGLLCTTNDTEDGNCNCIGTPVSLASDINADGITNTSDFLQLIGSFGEMCTCPEDINNDGTVSTIDFISLLAQFGLNCLGV